MKWARFFKIPAELLEDVKTSTSLISYTDKKEQHTQIANSHRLMNPVVKIGLCEDDFIRNLHTVVITYDRYRIPRIIKTRLLKRIKSPAS